MIRVIFDAYKLKHPNTGLYHFTKELAAALTEEMDSENEVAFFSLRKSFGALGDRAKFVPIRLWNALCIRPPRTVRVWHSPYQMSKFMPCGEKQKIVITVHDLNFLYEKSGAKRAAYLKKLQKNIDRADHIVAISKYSKQDLLKNVDIKGKPIDVIYNGCNVYTGEIKAPNTPSEKPFLFGIGTILPKKNWSVLPALLQDNDYMLYLAGKPSAYSETIMAEARKYDVADRVKLLGEVSEAEKHWYLKNCAAFLFPSTAEGFGLPVIEAMYYGKPVFISRHTSLPEVGGSFAYYFNYDFETELMRKEFAEGMSHFEKFGDVEAEREYALSFSWKRAAQEYLEIYKKLMH